MTPVEQIKARLSTFDVVNTYLKLTRAGSNFKAVCPFHTEKSPSFFVSPARDTWHCFGCGKGGDQFRFVMDMEGLDFREALEVLAQRAGVVLKQEDPTVRSERGRLFSLLEEATKFYEATRTQTEAVNTYLAQRGVLEESIQSFRIGYAPDQWRTLHDTLARKGFTEGDMMKAGVLAENGGKRYDRFRNRIVFPITDANARVIGFGGRIFPTEKLAVTTGPDAAKYINTPQTPLYDKSAVLYAFDKAKTAIRKENACILVEGYMDALMAHQAGTAHTVAVSGTALTMPQLTALKRLCDRMYMSFDADEAGESATRRSIDLALEMGFDVKAIEMSGLKDPADLVHEDPAAWHAAVAKADHVVPFFLARALTRWDVHEVEGKRQVARAVLPLIARVPQSVERAHWVTRLASRLGVKEEAVWDDLKKEKVATVSRGTLDPTAPDTRTRIDLLEERLLGIMLAHAPTLVSGFSGDIFFRPVHRAIFDGREALLTLPDSEQALANRLLFEAELLVEKDGAVQEVEACMQELQRERTKAELERISLDVRRAEEAGNAQQLATLVREFSETSKRLAGMR